MTNYKWRLYARPKGNKRFGPVDYSTGTIVTNLIYASMFTDEDKEKVQSDLDLPENQTKFDFEWRKL